MRGSYGQNARIIRADAADQAAETAGPIARTAIGQQSIETNAQLSVEASRPDQGSAATGPAFIRPVKPKAMRECSSLARWTYSQPLLRWRWERLSLTRWTGEPIHRSC